MYEIEFYEKTNGECNVWDFLQKTPKREIERAKAERDDYKARKEVEKK